MQIFKGETCDHCGLPDWSGFHCCQDCADRLAGERENETNKGLATDEPTA